jgi:hypothetical protein
LTSLDASNVVFDYYTSYQEPKDHLKSKILNISPNTADNEMRINFYLKKEGNLVIELCNLLGQVVKVLHNGNSASGERNIAFDISDIPTGFYYLKMQFDGRFFFEKVGINRYSLTP